MHIVDDQNWPTGLTGAHKQSDQSNLFQVRQSADRSDRWVLLVYDTLRDEEVTTARVMKGEVLAGMVKDVIKARKSKQ